MTLDFFKTLPQFLLPKKLLTQVAGYLAASQYAPLKNVLIRQFIRKFKVDMQEALQEEPTSYASFNEFFIRLLKPDCRPLSPVSIVSPADGMISEIGCARAGQLLQAKGHYYQISDLLASDAESCAPFLQAKFMTLYLSPKDYHRVHMPITARLKKMIYVPGKLFSVQPATVRTIPNLFAANERLVVFFETALGPMIMVMVGATIVGSMTTAWHGSMIRSNQIKCFDYEAAPIVLQQGEEMGYFKLGSTVIVLFAKEHAFDWVTELSAGSSIRFGEALGISYDSKTSTHVPIQSSDSHI